MIKRNYKESISLSVLRRQVCILKLETNKLQNLEIKQLSNEKKEALAGQFAAEATLRRVHATKEDEEFFPIVAVIAPLQSEIKKYKNEEG